MDLVPSSAVAMVIGLLTLIWAFLVHMMMSQADDAHLKFLLDLIAEQEQFKSSPPLGSSPRLADVDRMRTSHGTARSVVEGAKPQLLQHVWREVPLMFTMSLRGRGM
jgi:hypothetical protein